MAKKRDILKEAIADAKAVKEVAIENAKAALEESLPHTLNLCLLQRFKKWMKMMIKWKKC